MYLEALVVIYFPCSLILNKVFDSSIYCARLNFSPSINRNKSGVLVIGYRQTEKPQMGRRKTRRPIWGYSACLHHFHPKMR